MISEQERAFALDYEWLYSGTTHEEHEWVCLRPIGKEHLVYEPVADAWTRLRALEAEAGYNPDQQAEMVKRWRKAHPWLHKRQKRRVYARRKPLDKKMSTETGDVLKVNQRIVYRHTLSTGPTISTGVILEVIYTPEGELGFFYFVRRELDGIESAVHPDRIVKVLNG